MVWHWAQVNRRPSVEDRMYRAWEDDSLYMRGYEDGYHASFMYEAAVREWIRNGGKGDMPKYRPPVRSTYKRLYKHYERRYERGEHDR